MQTTNLTKGLVGTQASRERLNQKEREDLDVAKGGIATMMSWFEASNSCDRIPDLNQVISLSLSLSLCMYVSCWPSFYLG